MSKLREFIEEADMKLPRAKKSVSIKKELVEAARDCVAGVLDARAAGGRNGSKGKTGRPITDHTPAGKRNRARVARQYKPKGKKL